MLTLVKDFDFFIFKIYKNRVKNLTTTIVLDKNIKNEKCIVLKKKL